jgi:hypothetical protein
MMAVEREHVVALVISFVAILFIVGGFASFSGLATYSNTALKIDVEKDGFKHSDVLDASVIISLDTVLYDETLTLSMDGSVVKSVSLFDYISANGLLFSVEEKEGVKVLRLGEPVRVHLSEFINLESVASGKHSLDAGLGKGDVKASAYFRVG